MQAVSVLGRVDALQRRVVVEMLGQRQLHDVPGAVGIAVELVDRLVEHARADVGGQVAADRVDAHLGAIGVLTANVGLRARVVPDQDGAQPGRTTRSGQRGYALLQVDEDLVTGGLAVQRDCAHA